MSLHVWNCGNRDIRMFWTEPGTRQRRYLNVPANQFREFSYMTRVKSRIAPWIRLRVEKVKGSNGQSYVPLIDGFKTVDVVRLTPVKNTRFMFIEHDRKYYYVILRIITSCYILQPNNTLRHCHHLLR